MEGAKDSCKDNAVHYFYRWFLCPSFQILLSFLLFSTAMQSRSVESCSNYPGLKREVYLKLLLIFFKCYFFNDLLLLNFSHFHFKKKKRKDDYSVTDISKHIHSFDQLLCSQLLPRSKWPLPPEVCQDISMRPSLSSCKNSILQFKKAGMITDLQLK